jgi:hypothetical protein
MKYLFLFYSIILNLSFFAQDPLEGYDLDNPTFLDYTLSNYNIIFCPEMHWVSKNIDRRKKMTKYLVKHKKIDVIVLERSYSFGCWINYFIKTGDTLFLKDLFKDDYFS